MIGQKNLRKNLEECPVGNVGNFQQQSIHKSLNNGGLKQNQISAQLSRPKNISYTCQFVLGHPFLIQEKLKNTTTAETSYLWNGFM